MNKFTRQAKILEIIANNDIETQDELTEILSKISIEVTQATISRDIKELRLVKSTGKSGKNRYSTISQSQEGITERLNKIFENSVISIEDALNMIVIKTIPGAAQICASAIDYMGLEYVAGTIAGNDTTFVAIKSEKGKKFLLNEFRKYIH